MSEKKHPLRNYWYDSYATEFESAIDSVELVEGGGSSLYHVTLSSTLFYPTSGGQPNDTGSLLLNDDHENSFEVIDVFEKGEQIVHVLENQEKEISSFLKVGEKVKGKINWARRFDHMQQHSAQHLLSAILEKDFELDTVSVHIGRSCSIELDKDTDVYEIRKSLEDKFAKIAFENRPLTVTYEEIEKRLIRTVTIEGIDINKCCGTHVRATGELGILLILKSERLRGRTRFEYVAGARTLSYFQDLYSSSSNVAHLLKVKVLEIESAAEQLFEQKKALEQTLKKQNEERAQSLADQWAKEEKSEGRRVIFKEFEEEEAEFDFVQSIGKRILSCSKDMCYIGQIKGKPNDHTSRVLVAAGSSSGANAGKVVNALITKIGGGKGGGSATLAQAKLPKPVDKVTIEEILLM